MKVQIVPTGTSGLSISPAERLGREQFALYLDACRDGGARYNAETKCQIAKRRDFLRLAEALTKAGFSIERVAELEALVNEVRQVEEKDQKERAELQVAAWAHVERVEAELATRGLAPFPYQREGSRFLAQRGQALLDDEMGLGKTIQTLIAFPPQGSGIVVAPAAVKGVWKREILKWRPDLRPIILEGRGSFCWPLPGQVVILNYDLLPPFVLKATGKPPEEKARWKVTEVRPVARYGEMGAGTVLIADEAQYLKNRKAARTRRFHVLSHTIRSGSKAGRVWALTGTPLENSPPELYTILDVCGLASEAFGTYKRYKSMFRYNFNAEKPWGEPTEDMVEGLRKVSLRRRRAEVLPDLPTKTYRSVSVGGLSAELKEDLDRLVAKIKDGGIDMQRAGEVVDLVRIQELAFSEISRVRAALAVAKIPALLEFLEQYEDSPDPVVVFSAHREPVDAVAGRPGWARITGSESSEQKTEVENRFQRGELRGVAITIRAGGTGITLTRAHDAIFVDLEWTPSKNGQAEDRLCRIGQKNAMLITRLVADHYFDERLTEILHEKQTLIDGTVEAASRREGEILAEMTSGPARSAVPEIRFYDREPAPQARNIFDDKPEKEDPADQRSGMQQHAVACPSSSSKVAAPVPPMSVPSKTYSPKRPASTEDERFAASAMLALAGMDKDHATVVNGCGFSKMDNEFGHSLADQIRIRGMLSEKQWAAAVKLANRYRRQVGPLPSASAQGDLLALDNGPQ